MVWPARWVPIIHPTEIATFNEELRAELPQGHCLADMPLHAIGRRFDNIFVLFALDDCSGRVAEVVLPWKRRPMELPAPTTSLFNSFEVWARKVEYADWLAQLKPDPNVAPQLSVGDRVLMLKHSDWKTDCRGIIVGQGRPRIIFDGSTRVEYVIRFDEPQTDLTDELAGLVIHYESTTVLEEYLQPLGDETAAFYEAADVKPD